MATKKYFHNIKLGTNANILDKDNNNVTLTSDEKKGLDGASTALSQANPVATKVDLDGVTGKFKSIHLENATGVVVVNHGLNNSNLVVQAWDATSKELIDISCVVNTEDAVNKVDIDFGEDTIVSVIVNIIAMPDPVDNVTI